MPHKHYVGVKAAVVKDGKLLMERQVSSAGHKVFAMPGGRIEAGEDPIVALRREIREELGVECASVSPLPAWIYSAVTDAGQGIVVLVYRVMLASHDFRYDSSAKREVEYADFIDKQTFSQAPAFVHTPHILKYFDEFVAT